MRLVLAFALAWVSFLAWGQSEVFPFGDVKLGRKVLEQKCSSCHIARFGGDGSGMFTRANRKPTSKQSLLAWVQRCNANTRLGLDGEEEESVAAFLNEAYYKFK